MNLLSPIDIAGIALRNRIAVAPMSRTQADAHGHPAAETAAY
ncbi:NADH-dependent flavin oxidoreductase [Bordetella pertussis]|nr:NADH-dependent flavin oxidoreductase [Bordetella pertussis]